MNRVIRYGVCGIIFSGMLLIGNGALAAQDAHQTAPDNTRMNKTDRQSDVPTADQGKNNRNDRDIEKQIRRDVVKDKSLSTYGHNVKIISQGGKVTLRGPVHSEEEKRAIEEHARKYAGDGNVNNEISVKGDRK